MLEKASILNLKKKRFIFVYVCVCVWAHECGCHWKSRALNLPRAGVAGDFELPDVGIGNCTLALCQSTILF